MTLKIDLEDEVAERLEKKADTDHVSVEELASQVLSEFSREMGGGITERTDQGGEAKADEYFGAEEIRRLDELMKKWRTCRDEGEEMDSTDQAELDRLVDLEFAASGKRAAVGASK